MTDPSVRYRVHGLKCGGCVAKAKSALAQVPGYVEAEFDLPTGAVVVRGRADSAAVVRALAHAGYSATPEPDSG